MKYPLILCGDQVEFEREHDDTPLHERPDWPLPSFDARDWAAAFCKLNPQMDEGLMISWFANALMRGYDEHAARTLEAKAEIERLSHHEITEIEQRQIDAAIAAFWETWDQSMAYVGGIPSSARLRDKPPVATMVQSCMRNALIAALKAEV